MHSRSIKLKSSEETKRLGKIVAASVAASVIIGLKGNLGAGKTTFTQGLAEGLSIEEPVSSPTFLMLNEYHSGRLPLYHFDLYRLQEDLNRNSAAITALKEELDEMMHSDPAVLAVVEWIDLFEEFSAGFDTLNIEFNYLEDAEGREAVLYASGGAAEALLENCFTAFQSAV